MSRRPDLWDLELATDMAEGLASWMLRRQLMGHRPQTHQDDFLALVGMPLDLEAFTPAWNLSVLAQALQMLVVGGRVEASKGADGKWSYTLKVKPEDLASWQAHRERFLAMPDQAAWKAWRRKIRPA